MFRYFSKEIFRGPWREPAQWNETMCDKLMDEIRTIDFNNDLKKAGILVCGPNQSGKSSFVNSVISISKDRQAHVTAAMFSKTGVTFQCIRILSCDQLENFIITDTAGILEPDGRGFNIKDIIYCLQGNIKDGYEFQDTPISEDCPEYFTKSPEKEDVSHCLVFVLDVNLLDRMTRKYYDKIKEIVKAMTKERYPVVLILTKIDTIYPYLQRDITYMFRSSIVKEAVQKASEKFGLQERNIHPVINYTYELNNNKMKNIPILLALRQILHYAADKVQH